jgi:hypothetical protein
MLLLFHKASNIFVGFNCLLFLLLFAITAGASDIKLIPSLMIRGDYDDNVSFNYANEKSDYFTTTSPSFTFDYATELLKLSSEIGVDFLRYLDETQLNTENQRYKFDGAYQLFERLKFTGNLAYIKDTTLESELEETGVLSFREDRQRYIKGGGITHQIDELSDISLTYSHTRTDYDWQYSVDYKYYTIALTYNRMLKNNTDTFTLQPYYNHYSSDSNNIKVYAMMFGWRRLLSETSSFKAFAGVRYSRNDYKRTHPVITGPPFRVVYQSVRESDNRWGGLADISYETTTERSSTTLGYNHDLTYSSYGQPIEKDKLYASWRFRIMRRLETGLSANLYFTESDSDVEGITQEDSAYFNLTPSLRYLLTEDHSLRFGYTYARSRSTAGVTREYNRSRIWLVLEMQFPKQW